MAMSIELKKTDDINLQVRIGKQIVSERTDIYTGGVIENIKETIHQFNLNGQLKEQDILYVSVYNYWMYGFTTEEIFYLDLLNKTESEKQEYISHMDRINYMHHLNLPGDVHFLTNKYETYLKLKKYYDRDVIYIQSDSDYNVFCDFFYKHEEFVIKPVGMATSIGVRKLSRNDFEDNARNAFLSIISEIETVQQKYKWATLKGVVIEELIHQGEEMASLHPASVNSVRLTTIKQGEKVHIFYPVLRIGKAGEFLCCGAVGSILTGINCTTGICETDGYNEMNEHYKIHPDTKRSIKGIIIPKWKELCSMAKELAHVFPTLNYIGWDFVFTSAGKWTVMEANENGEFLGQIAYQRGLLKEFQHIIQWESPKEYWWTGKY